MQVLQSDFEESVKAAWIGVNYHLPGVLGKSTALLAVSYNIWAFASVQRLGGGQREGSSWHTAPAAAILTAAAAFSAVVSVRAL